MHNWQSGEGSNRRKYKDTGQASSHLENTTERLKRIRKRPVGYATKIEINKPQTNYEKKGKGGGGYKENI